MLKSLIQVITDKKIDGEMPICIADEKFKLTIILYTGNKIFLVKILINNFIQEKVIDDEIF
jgi:hypothetical protein